MILRIKESDMVYQPRVLFVDDEELFATRYVKRLERSGCHVIFESKVDLAYAKLRDYHFDVVVIDAIMPSPHSREENQESIAGSIWLLNKLAKSSHLAHLPIIVLSNLSESQLRADYQHYFNDFPNLLLATKFVTPPFALVEMIEKIVDRNMAVAS
jgi:CheY-like chemotaxis protein